MMLVIGLSSPHCTCVLYTQGAPMTSKYSPIVNQYNVELLQLEISMKIDLKNSHILK